MAMSKTVTGKQEKSVGLIGGKKYAGVIVNARPFIEVWPRCIYGFLSGKDHHGRGFDNGPIRTSLVEKFLVQDSKLYAITMNSAYQLETVNLLAFLTCPEWVDDVKLLVSEVTATVEGE